MSMDRMGLGGLGLAALIGAAMEEGPKLSFNDMVTKLRDAQARYTAKNPFAIGDLVIARPDGKLKRREGVPSVVIAVRTDAQPDFTSSELATRGNIFDTRIASLLPSGDVVALWVEAAECEPFVAATPDEQQPEAPEAAAA